MDETQAEQIASLTGASTDEVKKVVVKRTLGGTYTVNFPDANPVRTVEKAQVAQILSNALDFSVAQRRM